MIPVQLSLKNRKVLIVGGGKVALRKVKLFLKEDANITVLAPSMIDELNDYECHRIHKCYESNDIHGYFLVYACTSDKEINKMIVDDCRDMNILCGSATYNDDASFYSMGMISHDIGTLALSMNQCLPYHKPLLHMMKNVLDENQKRIEKLFEMRPYILNCITDKKKYFELLFECREDLLDFLLEVLKGNRGYIFVYHDHEYEEQLLIKKENSILLSIKVFIMYSYLFEELKNIVVVPYVVSKGYIYNKIQSVLPHHSITLPLLSTENDIINLVHLLEDKDKKMVYIIHPRQDDFVRNGIRKLIREQDIVIDFNDEIVFDLGVDYKCVVLLMSHGSHFREYCDMFDFKIKEGYNIEYIACLSDDKQFVDYVMNRLE